MFVTNSKNTTLTATVMSPRSPASEHSAAAPHPPLLPLPNILMQLLMRLLPWCMGLNKTQLLVRRPLPPSPWR